MFTRGTGFWHTAIYIYIDARMHWFTLNWPSTRASMTQEVMQLRPPPTPLGGRSDGGQGELLGRATHRRALLPRVGETLSFDGSSTSKSDEDIQLTSMIGNIWHVDLVVCYICIYMYIYIYVAPPMGPKLGLLRWWNDGLRSPHQRRGMQCRDMHQSPCVWRQFWPGQGLKTSVWKQAERRLQDGYGSIPGVQGFDTLPDDRWSCSEKLSF